jgi:hypothetical protein
MCFYVHAPVDAGGWWSVATIIPAMGVVMIAVIIVTLVATRQGKGHDEGEDSCADDAFDFIFHDR